MNHVEDPRFAEQSLPRDGTALGAAYEQSKVTRQHAFDWRYVIFGGVILVLVYQVAVPLVVLIWASLTEARPGSPDFFLIDQATLANYAESLQSPYLYEALWNTTVFTTGVTVTAFVLGSALAWLVVRTDMPLRGLITVLCLVRLIVPGILTTIAWVFLAGPEIGLLNTLARNVFGFAEPLLNVYTMAGMIWVEAMDVLPLAFLLMSAALRSMDPSLEEASLVSGKSLGYTMTRVTFPILLPSVLATLILLIIRGIETFETPAIIGVPAGIMTFVTEIWINTSTTPTDLGLAATYAVLVLLLCLCLVLAYNRATRHSAMFATVSGKAFRPRITELGSWRWPAFGFAIAIMFASVLLPMLILLWSSFMPRFMQVSGAALQLATLENYISVLERPLTRRAFLNSTFLGVTSATATVFLISIVAWLTVKTRIRGRQALDMLAFAPIAVPAIMMGVAFLWLYLILPVPVYGTIWILFLLYVARYMPVVMRVLSASMVQIGNELHEAAEVTGATWWRSFRTVTLPLLRPGLVAAWVFVLIHAFRELSGSLIVYAAGTEPIGVAIFDLWEEGSFPLLSAFGVIVFIVLIVLAVTAQRFGARFGVRDV